MPRARRAAAAFLLAALAAAGCGDGPKYVTVTGRVTVDNKPYKNAIVSFQPLASKDNPTPGRGSSGITDADGRYTLVADGGVSGAVPGKHRVRIQTKRESGESFFDPATGTADGQPAVAKKGQRTDPIPTEWYSDKGTKEFEVPAGGTDTADFAITSAGAGKN